VKKSKEHDAKKPAKTDRQKKAEAEMMKTLITQYVSETLPLTVLFEQRLSRLEWRCHTRRFAR
jgi:hypothetical protein